MTGVLGAEVLWTDGSFGRCTLVTGCMVAVGHDGCGRLDRHRRLLAVPEGAVARTLTGRSALALVDRGRSLALEHDMFRRCSFALTWCLWAGAVFATGKIGGRPSRCTGATKTMPPIAPTAQADAAQVVAA